jgi:GT2 family glycosyltransferase
MANRLAVIVVTWNSREDTLRCLASLRGELGSGDTVVVVDNASTDGTADGVRREHPRVHVLGAGANVGFAGGNNIGLRWALDQGYRWVLLLNADTVVPPGTIEPLVAFAEAHPHGAAFQPLLVRDDAARATIDSSGQAVFRYPGAEDAQAGEPVAAAPSGPAPIFGACAAASLIRVEALRRVGLLDEGFFCIFEDTDLAFRLQLAGYGAAIEPRLRIFHRRGVSGPQPTSAGPPLRRLWVRRNLVAIALRYWPLGRLVLAGPLLAARAALAWVDAARLGERCGPLWVRSLRLRRGIRREMRRRGLDRLFAPRPLRAYYAAALSRDHRGPANEGHRPAFRG